MNSKQGFAPEGVLYCARLIGTGDPGPIEARLGRRLVRLVDPRSAEGRTLLASGAVEIIGPEGDALGRIDLDEAKKRVGRRLDQRASSRSHVTTT